MNLVIISTIAGVIPTLANLKEGQLGVNTADGRLFVNTGIKIKAVGGNVWKPIGNTEDATHTVTTGDTTFETVVDLIGPVLVGQASISANISNPAAIIEGRMTVNGVVHPTYQLTGNTVSNTKIKDLIGRYQLASQNTDNGIQAPAIYCEDSFKFEIRHVSGAADGNAAVGFSYGTME